MKKGGRTPQQEKSGTGASEFSEHETIRTGREAATPVRGMQMQHQQQPMMQYQQQMQPGYSPQMQYPMMMQQQMQQPGGPPIMLPRGDQWMTLPAIPEGMMIPPGLEYLLACQGAHVRQKTDLIEVFTNIDTPNKYAIYNDQGQFMYYAKEHQDVGRFFEAQWLRDNRGFTFIVTDGMGRHAFSIYRSSKVWTDCEMIVEAPPGVPAGFVSYNSTCCSRGVLTVFDARKQPVLALPFPADCDCGGDRGYAVVTGSGTIGSIVRKYPGFMKHMYTTCDNFALNFPMDLDVRMKCCLLSCAIMIDFIDFEKRNNGNEGGYNRGYY